MRVRNDVRGVNRFELRNPSVSFLTVYDIVKDGSKAPLKSAVFNAADLFHALWLPLTGGVKIEYLEVRKTVCRSITSTLKEKG